MYYRVICHCHQWHYDRMCCTDENICHYSYYMLLDVCRRIEQQSCGQSPNHWHLTWLLVLSHCGVCAVIESRFVIWDSCTGNGRYLVTNLTYSTCAVWLHAEPRTQVSIQFWLMLPPRRESHRCWMAGYTVWSIWHVISRSGEVILITNCYIRFTVLKIYSLPVFYPALFWLPSFSVALCYALLS